LTELSFWTASCLPIPTVLKSSCSATVRRTRKRRINRDMLLAILVITPSIIAVAVFIYSFIAWTFWISTVNWNTPVIDYTFVGLKNWSYMLSSSRFQIDLRNLVLHAGGFMLQCIVIGFLLASLLDQRIKGESVFRTIFIFPFAISAVVTGVAWRWLMRPETGINLLFESVGLGFLRSKWFADPTWGILFITMAASWQFSGYVMALYLAGLRGISNEIKEAAKSMAAASSAFTATSCCPSPRWPLPWCCCGSSPPSGTTSSSAWWC